MRRRDRKDSEPSYRFDRRLAGLRITNRSGTRSWRQFEQDNAILTSLADNGQVETLRRVASGKLKMPALRAAQARGQLASGSLEADMALALKLWPYKAAGEHEAGEGVFMDTLPRMGRSPASRARYEVSMLSLQRKAAKWLGKDATVADLPHVPWPDLLDSWDSSGSDWNRMRSMLSSFCTQLLGDKFHPFRRELMKKVPLAEEVERVCAITVGQFWAILQHVPDYAQPIYVTLVATGMRWGEYARCTRSHLNPARHSVTVPVVTRRKNAKKKPRTVVVAEWLWPWIEAGVPHPLAYKWTRTHWRRALEKEGVSDVRLHDLRHLHGQLGIQGADISAVADTLGHTQLSTTRRYVRDDNQTRVARVVGRKFRPAGGTPAPVARLVK